LVVTLALQGAVTTGAQQKFSLICWHDFTRANEYLDPDATLLIVRSPGPIN